MKKDKIVRTLEKGTEQTLFLITPQSRALIFEHFCNHPVILSCGVLF